MSEKNFVYRELRFTDERILEWMKIHLLNVYEPYANFGRQGYLFDCEILLDSIAPRQGYFMYCYAQALTRWGFSDVAGCSVMWFRDGEFLLTFCTSGNLHAPWFLLLSQAIVRDLPDAQFTVESHINGGFGKGTLCAYQGGTETELESWDSEFQSFDMSIVLPGELEFPLEAVGMELVHRIGGSSRHIASFGYWNVCYVSNIMCPPCTQAKAFPTCQDALAHFISRHYPIGAEGLLLRGRPILSLSGEINTDAVSNILEGSMDDERL